VAGAVEESSKGQGSIAAGVPLMLFIIFTLLMLQLQSFSRSVLVFLTGPLGIAGVAARCCCWTGRSASWRCWA
jgi:multidrug efflux pump